MSNVIELHKRIEKTIGFIVTEALDPDASPETIASAKYKCDAYKDVLKMIKEMMDVDLNSLPQELKRYAAEVVLKEFPDYATEDCAFKKEKIARFSKLVYAGAEWIKQIGTIEGDVCITNPAAEQSGLGIRAELPEDIPLKFGDKVNILIYK